MLRITPLFPADIDAVVALARGVWQATYPALISQAQIDRMLADRYAPHSIRQQLDDPRHAWRLAWMNEELAGFAHASLDESACKLDKLYIGSRYQRQGLGAALLQTVQTFACGHNAQRLWLQVNRGNEAALAAYRKYGFRVVEARVFDIGAGFVMDDYVMEMTL